MGLAREHSGDLYLTNRQNQTYYNVFNGNRLVEKNASNHIEYDLFASANVNDAGGYYSYRIEITFEVSSTSASGV